MHFNLLSGRWEIRTADTASKARDFANPISHFNVIIHSIMIVFILCFGTFQVKEILKGMDTSNSIVIDPHAKLAVEYALGE